MERAAMRQGTAISGALHGGLILLAVIGTDWFAAPEPLPFAVTEVSLIDGARFDALVSSAPAPERDAPEAVAPSETADVSPAPATAESAPETAPLPVRARPDPPGDAPVIAAPPPPAPVPSAEARPSIAEVPTPDSLARQAAEPESPPATEVVQPLAAADVPLPGARPGRPPDPEPDPEPQAEPAPPPEPSPETGIAEAATPEGPDSAAPQEARLPVARPADRAAAAMASRDTRQPDPAAEREPAPTETAEPETAPAPPPGAASRFAAEVTRGERDALRLGLRAHFFYRGTRSDPSLAVRVGISLDPAGRITSGPELLEARGGTEGERAILFRDARTALIRAMQAGVFAALPADRHAAWARIHVTFTPEEIGFSS